MPTDLLNTNRTAGMASRNCGTEPRSGLPPGRRLKGATFPPRCLWQKSSPAIPHSRHARKQPNDQLGLSVCDRRVFPIECYDFRSMVQRNGCDEQVEWIHRAPLVAAALPQPSRLSPEII